jgi:hypothetical protein
MATAMKSTMNDQVFMIAISGADLWPNGERGKLRVRFAPEFGERAYIVSNPDNDHVHLVYFELSPQGKKLANCNCEDFTFNKHACKHIRAAAPLHVWRMRQASDDPRFITSFKMRQLLNEDLKRGGVTDFRERMQAILERECDERAAVRRIREQQRSAVSDGCPF